ncbi:ubiquinol-cytochrome c reductase core subunit 1 [Ceratobasidium sp. 414]|nr:ubiquinol-cytochrome c reductase core subunit 1 [Ceratobasidium sp. 414]
MCSDSGRRRQAYEVTRINYGAKTLVLVSSVLTSPQFLLHKLTETVLPTSIAESTAALSDSATHALELAHALAFRSSGLGSPLFAAHPSPKSLDALAASAFTKGNVVVTGTGVDPPQLSQLVENHLASLPSGATAPGGSSQYFGGETRVDAHGFGQARFVGFGAPGAAHKLAALHAHLDTTPALKWVAGSSPLAGIGAAPVCVPYSDAALFGVLVRAETAAEASKGVKATVSGLKNVASGLGADEAKRAAAKAKFAAAASLEGREGLVAAVAPQASRVFGAAKADIGSVYAALDKVSWPSVAQTLSSIIKAKLTYVAVGDIYSPPYVDDFGL